MKTNRNFSRKNENSLQNNQQQYYEETPNNFNEYNQSSPNYRQVELYNDQHYDPDEYVEDDEDQNEYKIDDRNQPTMYSNLRENKNVDFANNSDGRQIQIDDDFDEIKDDPVENIPKENTPKEQLHFSTKIKNSGFWGDVYLRNGTWLVIIGFCMFVVSTVLIGVFWGFWYSNAVNFPMRILAITLLSCGILLFICGLISNYMMFKSSENKFILGSPLRTSTRILIVCFVLLVVASDCITVYYTYWANRWVNTPLIIVAIVLYFFAGIGFLSALIHIFEFNFVRHGLMKKREKRSVRNARKDNERQKRLERLLSIESIVKDTNKKSWEVLNAERQGLIAFNETEIDQSLNEGRKGFRKGQPIKLTPKPVILNSNVTSLNVTEIEQ